MDAAIAAPWDPTSTATTPDAPKETSAQNKTRLTRAQRDQCRAARDAFFHCTRHHIADEATYEPCLGLREAFKTACPAKWFWLHSRNRSVKHFEELQFRSMEKGE